MAFQDTNSITPSTPNNREEYSKLLVSYGSTTTMGSSTGASGDISLMDQQQQQKMKMKMQDSSSGGLDDPTVSSHAPTDDEIGGHQHHSSLFDIQWTLRKLALELSLYLNLFITAVKFVAYIRTMSLSVLAALLDSVLDVVSQVVLNYTEKHSTLQRSSAFYPAGASRLEPIGVLTCAALMGMASFEVLKESFTTLIYQDDTMQEMSIRQEIFSFWSMIAVVILKLLLLMLCQKASNRQTTVWGSNGGQNDSDGNTNINGKAALQLADPTLEALSQDHYNDVLSNGVAAIALILSLYSPTLWFLDPFGAILISLYIIYSWYHTGKEQIEQLTGKSAPDDFIDELLDIAEHFDERMVVDTCRAYHFGPKFLVELEVVLPKHTLLVESHDLGMELQYEIEGREEVERCFVHIDYETRDYDEHVVSKVPELREHLLRNRNRKLLKSHASV
jgi:cation diffusion facilitator family transporter